MEKTLIEKIKNWQVLKLETSFSKSGVCKLSLVNTREVVAKAEGCGYRKTDEVFERFFRELGFLNVPTSFDVESPKYKDFLLQNGYNLDFSGETLSGHFIQLSKI